MQHLHQNRWYSGYHFIKGSHEVSRAGRGRLWHSTKGTKNLDYLWKNAGLSYTPKLHNVLAHALNQIRECQGIEDMLEDDVEHPPISSKN